MKTAQEKINNNEVYFFFEDNKPKSIKGYTKAGKWKENFNKIIDLLEED